VTAPGLIGSGAFFVDRVLGRHHCDGMEHQSNYIRMAPLLIAVLVMLGMVIAGAMMAADPVETRMRAVRLIIGGVCVGIAGVVTLPLFLSRRQWRVENGMLHIRQGLALLPRAMAQRVKVSLADIVSVERMYAGAREVIVVTTQAGDQHRMMVSGSHPIIASVLSGAGQAQNRNLTLREGLGFWAGGMGILLIVIALIFSAVIAAVSVWAMVDGAMVFPGGSPAGKALGVAVILPFGLGWALVQVMKRRANVRTQGKG
jgi:hypothetical protein